MLTYKAYDAGLSFRKTISALCHMMLGKAWH